MKFSAIAHRDSGVPETARTLPTGLTLPALVFD